MTPSAKIQPAGVEKVLVTANGVSHFTFKNCKEISAKQRKEKLLACLSAMPKGTGSFSCTPVMCARLVAKVHYRLGSRKC